MTHDQLKTLAEGTGCRVVKSGDITWLVLPNGEEHCGLDWLTSAEGMAFILEWLRQNHRRPILGGTSAGSRQKWYSTTEDMRPFASSERLPPQMADTPMEAVAMAALAALAAMGGK
jgi:hypothetical protein